MPGLSQPNRMGTTLSRTTNLLQDAAPTGDTLAIGAAGMLKGLFDKTSTLLGEQEALLQSLPSQIRTTAEQILQNSLPDLSTLSDGLVSLLHTRRTATDSLVQLAEKLQLAASSLTSSQDKPAELLIAIKRVNQQVTGILAKLDLDANEIDPAVLQQARDQIQSAVSDMLRQATTRFGQKPSLAGISLQPSILHATDNLSLPEVPQNWLLTDTDLGALQDNTPPAILEQKATTGRALAESVNRFIQTIDDQGQADLFTSQKLQLTASVLESSQDKPAELFNEIKRFTQHMTSILTELDLDANEIDQAMLQQARDQIRSAIPDILRQSSAKFAAQQSSSAGVSTPSAIHQAADKLNLPELLQLWLLTDMELGALLDNTTPSILEQSAATVRTLAESVNRAFQTISDDQGQAVLFTLQMPFNGEPAQPQPVHIHVFHEKGQTKKDGSESKPDTWVRLTLDPENTGQVDTIFHLHGEAILDIKVAFANKQASLLFSETLPLIREACSEFPFMLGDVSIV
jgi:3-oxoacyl-[acyl-carrier-protein] synthase III